MEPTVPYRARVDRETRPDLEREDAATRNWLSEALAIVTNKSLLLPTDEHLKAMFADNSNPLYSMTWDELEALDRVCGIVDVSEQVGFSGPTARGAALKLSSAIQRELDRREEGKTTDA